MTFFTTIVPGRPPMMPNTALALLMLGVAGALRHREDVGRVRRTLSLLAAIAALAVGIGTMAEYVLQIDLKIDRLFVGSQVGPYPGRPSPPTALALTLLSVAILLFDARPKARARPSEWLVLSAWFIALAASFGQLFGAGLLYRLTHAPVIGVAVPTALSVLLTAVGLLLERPDAGVMRLATSAGPGGILLRSLSLVAILAPAVIGYVVARILPGVGVEDFPLVFASMAAAMTAMSLFLLTVTAARLNRTHDALEFSRARTRELIEHASDGIFVADLAGRYTDINSAACRMLGYSREEIVGRTIADLIPPEDAERLSQTKEHLLEGGIHVAEWILRRKNGTFLPVELSSKILPDGRWQMFVRDIAERKEMERALRLSEAKSSGIVSISADAIISIDEDQRITMFNDGAEKIFGYSKEEAVGAPLDILIPERFQAIHREHVERFAAGREVARRMGERGAEIVGLRKSGEEFPADAAISKLEASGKRILTVALRDVTAQRRIENEQKFLAEVGSVLASTLDYEETAKSVAKVLIGELADFCIVESEEERGQVHRLVVAHRDPGKATEARNLQEIQLDRRRPYPGSSVFETKQPLLIEEVTPEYLESIAQSEEHRQALRALSPKSLMAVPLLARGWVVGSMVLIRTTAARPYRQADLLLVERVALRAALAVENARLYQTAQRAVQARDDVLGVVAHDLRTPLGTILMQASLLRRRGVEPERRSPKPAETIERAANRMDRLIQDLLDVTRMEAGRLSVEQCRVSADKVVSDCMDAQQPLASQTSLELLLDVQPALPEVWADRDRLVQVFENLIGNAIKFTEPGGRITVGAAPRDGDVLFWVADTGPGIAAEDLPHLFDRFWQARRAGRRGAGLGLPIVKGLVEAHGGRIWVESPPGRGSTFFFTIPAAARHDP